MRDSLTVSLGGMTTDSEQVIIKVSESIPMAVVFRKTVAMVSEGYSMKTPNSCRPRMAESTSICLLLMTHSVRTRSGLPAGTDTLQEKVTLPAKPLGTYWSGPGDSATFSWPAKARGQRHITRPATRTPT